MLKRSLADVPVTTDYGEGPLPPARPTAYAMLWKFFQIKSILHFRSSYKMLDELSKYNKNILYFDI